MCESERRMPIAVAPACIGTTRSVDLVIAIAQSKRARPRRGTTASAPLPERHALNRRAADGRTSAWPG